MIITQDTDSKFLTKTSKFCLDVAFHRDGYVDEIWVLSPGYKPIETDNAQFARWVSDVSAHGTDLGLG